MSPQMSPLLHARPLVAPAEQALSSEERATRDAQVQLDSLKLLLQSSASPLLGQWLVAAALVWFCWRPGATGHWLLVWLAGLGLCTAATFRLTLPYRRRPPDLQHLARFKRLNRGVAAIAIAGGLIWAVGVALMWFGATEQMISVVAISLVGLTYLATHSLQLKLPAYFGFTTPLWCSVLVQVLLLRSEFWPWKALFVVMYWAGSGAFAVISHRRYATLLQQRWLLSRQASELQRLTQRAEQALSAKSRLLAAASHDLYQPVHALALLVGALHRRPPERESVRLLDHLENTVQAMAAQFGSLLDLSRLESGGVRPELRAFDLWPLLERIAADEALLAGRKGLRLRLRAATRQAEGPLVLQTDPVLLERILRNLTANAVRYTERGGVLVCVRNTITGLVIQVADSGIGIEAARQASIFEEFVQGHGEGPGRRAGLGLGLTIVRQLVDLLGLQLRLRSRPGLGTVFRLRLPLPLPLGRDGGPLASGDGLEPTPGALVLVVADDAATRAGLTSLLASWGLEVVAAANAADLWPKLLAFPDVPDLIIMDLRMDDEADGPAVIDRLREEYNQQIPALLVSADLSPLRLKQALAKGLVLLDKPPSPRSLEQAVAAALAPRWTAAAPLP